MIELPDEVRKGAVCDALIEAVHRQPATVLRSSFVLRWKEDANGTRKPDLLFAVDVFMPTHRRLERYN